MTVSAFFVTSSQNRIWAVVPDAPNAAPVMQYAVNVANRAESDVRPPDNLPAAATAEETGLVGGFGGRPLWFYLLCGAFVLGVGEWYLYQRRWIS